MTRFLRILVAFAFCALTANGQVTDTVFTLTPTPNRKVKLKAPKSPLHVKNIHAQLTISPSKVKEGKGVVTLNVSINCDELVFRQVDDKVGSTLKFYFRIRSRDGTIDGFLEGDVQTWHDVDELKEPQKCSPMVMRRSVSLPEGQYRAEALIKEVLSGRGSKLDLPFVMKE